MTAPSKPVLEKDDRNERLAAALRENLKRRKAQARVRQDAKTRNSAPQKPRQMTILSDRWIRRMAQEKGMIEPFVDAQKREGVISYGLSSYGYDARVGREFKIFTNVNSRGGRSQELRRQQLRRPQRPMSASSRPTPSRWRARSNISASRATCW